MGEVLLARDMAAGERQVALKVLRPEFRDATPIFMQEYVLQRRLRHPGIPEVYDFGFAQREGGEVPYFVMEYVTGIPLVRLMDPLPPLELVWIWTLEVLRALDHMHAVGYIHRDIKPANILVDPRNKATGLHLIDFGITVEAGAEPEEFFVGTPEYSAPEVMAEGPFDPRADLYALGLVIYELIEGRRPWDGTEPEELWLARTTTNPPAIETPDVPEPVKQLILQMLKPRLDDRPRSAAAVIERLAAAVDQPAVIETPFAFRMSLEASPLSSPSRAQAVEERAPIVAIAVAGGEDARRLLDDIGDQRAVRGVRVVRISLEATGPNHAGLDAIKPVLDVFRRLRIERDGQAPNLPGLAGAATMLARMHRPTLLCIEGIQRASGDVINVLSTVFTGASNANLRVVATLDPAEKATAPDALETLMAARFVKRLELEALTFPMMVEWMTSFVGEGVFPDAVLQDLLADADGSPNRLIERLTTCYQRGGLKRTATGYEWVGDPADITDTRRFTPPKPDEAEEALDMVACLRVPVPHECAETFFGGGLEALFDAGLLKGSAAGWTVRANNTRFGARYAELPQARRHQLNQSLAEAIAAADPFPGRSALLADVFLATARPAQAIPHLLTAANTAIANHREAAARTRLEKAISVLRLDDSEDATHWQWEVSIERVHIRLARQTGDIESLGRAAGRLFGLGLDGVHTPTMHHALAASMEQSYILGAWNRLVEDSEQLLRLEPDGPTPEARALWHWAHAHHAWSIGDINAAQEALDDAVNIDAGVSVGTRIKLNTARSELAIACRIVELAPDAIQRLMTEARNAKDSAAQAIAGVMHCAYLLDNGAPAQALEKIQEVSAEYGGRADRGVNGRIELEFARVHLEFGWWRSAIEHSVRAQTSANRDNDARTAYAAETIHALAVSYLGRHETARRATRRLLDNPPPQALPTWRHAAYHAHILVAFRAGEPAERIIRAASDGFQAATETQNTAYAIQLVALATRAALQAGDAKRSVQFADWLHQATSDRPGTGVPKHLVRYLRACAHHRMKWFSSAKTLRHGAMESLRRSAQRIEDPIQRRAWLDSPDNAIVGRGSFDTGFATAASV